MLKLDQVHSGYGAIDVLKDITLEVGAGEIVALLGANGAGKSTTLLTIAGVVPVRSGSVTWQGEPLPGRADAVLRRGICLCPEGRHIFPRLTVLENLYSGSFLHPASRNQGKLDEIYSYFPLLAERRSQLGGTLSGGEQQMLAIGRALMGEPKLLRSSRASSRSSCASTRAACPSSSSSKTRGKPSRSRTAATSSSPAATSSPAPARSFSPATRCGRPTSANKPLLPALKASACLFRYLDDYLNI